MVRRSRPKDWGIGLGAGVVLVLAIAVLLAAVVFGLLYLLGMLLSAAITHSNIPW